jgi:hypothetical protein
MAQYSHEVVQYNIFISSAPEDATWCRQLVLQFRPLQPHGLDVWHDERIIAGDTVNATRAQARQQADLVLLLISAPYLNSERYEEDLQFFQTQPQNGTVQIVSLLLHPCLWDVTSLASFSRVFPANQEPLALSPQPEATLALAAREIVRQFLPSLNLIPPLLSAAARTNRERLIKRVRDIWIRGILENSLHQAARLDLHLQDQPDALDDPWRLEYQEAAQQPRLLPPGTNLLQIYDEANGELLILGEPGSGKTTLLLELTRSLLTWAERDSSLPIPVVFYLSSWNSRDSSLSSWLIDELASSKYHSIDRRVATEWIDNNQLLPLLDGLDEIPEPARARCVQAINTFQQERSHTGTSPLVVCCRTQDYQRLAPHLLLTRAVSIRPLTDDQIFTYLARSQGQLKDLHNLLLQDTVLLSLARQPLMLTICTLAYQERSVTHLSLHHSPATMQQAIFADYIQRMLSHRKKLPSWMETSFLPWLKTIAQHMQQQQTVFSIEDLQPDWLPKKYYWFYRWSIVLVLGLLLGSFFGFFTDIVAGILLGPLLGLLDGLLLTVLATLLLGLPTGLLFGSRKIEIAEVISWSWKNILDKPFIGLFFGLLTGALGWLAFELVAGLFGANITLLYKLIFSILLGLSVCLSIQLSNGFSGKPLVERFQLAPNEGIWRSAKNGLLCGIPFGLLFGCLIGGLVGVLAGVLYGVFIGLLTGTFIDLVFGMFGGLSNFFQHFTLRFWLWRTKILPWKIEPFLEEATRRLFLQRIGGSYIFIHRLLLEYLASSETDVNTIN